MLDSNVPIGGDWTDSIQASECLYARDFPLIAGAGANTVRTLALVRPGSRAFSRALAANGLYWLAGFPLDRFFDPARSLAAAGQESDLRARILAEFRAYVAAWTDEPRLLAFVFGNEVDVDYVHKFGGSTADFFSLLREAAAVVNETAPGRLITSSVGDAARIGAFNLGTNDPNQPALSFWSVYAPGRAAMLDVVREARNRTAKPFLISGFGADAYDPATQSEASGAQAEAARGQAQDLGFASGNASYALIGAVWSALLDEWWRGGPDPTRHGAGATETGNAAEPLHPAWLGLFGVSRGAVAGFDSLRPREAYFALAQEWGGVPPPELSLESPPAIDSGGVTSAASGAGLLAPGSLFAIRGSAFTAADPAAASGSALPYQIGVASVCIAQQPAPLYYAATDEIRAQLPWEVEPGSSPAILYRAGVASQPATAEVLAHAPGIFPGGVLEPGLPCPIDGANGIRPGGYLEVYGTGLGAVAQPVTTGVPRGEPSTVSDPPHASLGDGEAEVVFSGLLAGVAGVYQTNVKTPPDLPPGVAELRLSQGALLSNAVPIQIVAANETQHLLLDRLEPETLLVQAGGPPRQALVRILGRNGFCDLVRFEVQGLPPGVHASIPVGFPGRTVPFQIWADPAAPRADDAPVTLKALSSLPDTPAQTLRVTVLPALGDLRFRVVSGGWLSGSPLARFEIDGRVIFETQGGGPGRGFNFLTIDAQTGALGAVRSFDTWGSPDAVKAMENYLRSLPAGTVVIAAIADDGSLLLSGDTRDLIRGALGSQLIDNLDYQYSWAIISRAGSEQPIAEGVMATGRVVLERVLTFPMP